MAASKDTSTIADLDKVVASDIYVVLNGERRPLPGDAPSELLLRITLLSEELEKAVEAKDAPRMLEIREEISANVEELFALRNPQLPEGSITLSDAQVGELVAKLFAHYYGKAVEDAAAEEEAEAARPTEEEPEAETPPTTPRSESAKPSPPSSARRSRRARSSARSRSSASSPN